jgi:uridine kinase
MESFDHPDAFDNGLYLAHLDALTSEQQVAMPTYDFAAYVRLPEVLVVPPQPVVLLEGILIFADAQLRARMGVKIC